MEIFFSGCGRVVSWLQVDSCATPFTAAAVPDQDVRQPQVPVAYQGKLQWKIEAIGE